MGSCATSAAGVVVAVKGHALPNGDFEVSAVCYAGVPPQPARPVVDGTKCVVGRAGAEQAGRRLGPESPAWRTAPLAPGLVQYVPCTHTHKARGLQGLHAASGGCAAPKALPWCCPGLAWRRYVALVSGVGVGEGEGNPLHLQLLVDYLGGLLGSSAEQDTVSKVRAGRGAWGQVVRVQGGGDCVVGLAACPERPGAVAHFCCQRRVRAVQFLRAPASSAWPAARLPQVVRVVVAGGLLHTNSKLSQPTAYSSVRQQAVAVGPVRWAGWQRTGTGARRGDVGNRRAVHRRGCTSMRGTPSATDCYAPVGLPAFCRDVDMCLTELAGSLPVDVMPGAGDPANYSLPQQPLHKCLFPGAAAFPTLQARPDSRAGCAALPFRALLAAAAAAAAAMKPPTHCLASPCCPPARCTCSAPPTRMRLRWTASPSWAPRARTWTTCTGGAWGWCLGDFGWWCGSWVRR